MQVICVEGLSWGNPCLPNIDGKENNISYPTWPRCGTQVENVLNALLNNEVIKRWWFASFLGVNFQDVHMSFVP